MNNNIIKYDNGIDFEVEPIPPVNFTIPNGDGAITELEKLVAIACSPGHYDYDEYMYGMANGLILALAVMKDEEPQYLDRPEQWLWSLNDTKAHPLGAAGEYGTQPEPCSTRDDGWDAPDENVELDGDFWNQPDVKQALEEGANHIAETFDREIRNDLRKKAIQEDDDDYKRAMKGL